MIGTRARYLRKAGATAPVFQRFSGREIARRAAAMAEWPAKRVECPETVRSVSAVTLTACSFNAKFL
jgi:hypothetical protein